MHEEPFWLFGLLFLVLPAVIALISIRLVTRPKGKALHAALNEVIRLSKKETFGRRRRITRKAGKHTVRWEKLTDGLRQYLKISLESENLLPVPLEIAKTGRLFTGHGGGHSLRIGPDDFSALNRSIGRELFTRRMAAEINSLNRRCLGFSIFGARITALARYRLTTVIRHEKTDALIVRLASSLQAVRDEADLRLHSAAHVLRRRTDTAQRLIALGVLLKYYPDHRWTRSFLKELSAGPDFDLAAAAVVARSLDPETFAMRRIESGDRTNKLKAIAYLAEHGTPKGLDFLLDYFPRAAEPAVVRATCLAFGRFADQKAENPLLGALACRSVPVKLASLSALAACGGESALEPLYEVFADRTQTASVRRAAAETTVAIRERLHLGSEATGRLSLTGPGNAAGLLSLADKKKSEAGSRPTEGRRGTGANKAIGLRKKPE